MNILFSELTSVFLSDLQMAEEISRPLCEAQKVTMVSSGGSEVGAAKLAGEVLDIMTRLPAAIEKLTGIDISQVCWGVSVGDWEVTHKAEPLVQVVIISRFLSLISQAGAQTTRVR